METKGITLSIFAGSFAALASVSAKLVTSSEITYISEIILGSSGNAGILQHLPLVIRGVCLIAVFLSNALMWTFFTKSLQYLSSIQATITNTSTNFLVSAIIGKILFKELLPILWWIGSVFILLGLLLIHKDGQKTKEIKEKKS
ncbi:hypothetical protein LOTGIDRAFT_232853 [Lottia gigantea]|uniref:EamA domain-containing protein n=1 Tax=Lottia gigantea TaxID=225164 RepID=V4ADD2_LOTGI|nr:hypothetical protein LOTGIDRAFT_232853 [Lottia gigantea]ESO93130.1 hypothetical protein LOTGIDRAFT_232853 [Lottia gigantea]